MSLELQFPLTIKGPSARQFMPSALHDGGDFGILDAKGDVLIEVYGRVGERDYQDAGELALKIKRGLESFDVVIAALVEVVNQGVEYSGECTECHADTEEEDHDDSCSIGKADAALELARGDS